MKYELIALFCRASAISLGGNTPRSTRMTSSGTSSLAAAHRVVHRVHRNAAHVGSFSCPARSPGFSERNIFVIDIANLANGSLALNRDQAHLARRHAKCGVLSFTGDELSARTCRTGQLAAFARPHLYIVYDGAKRQVGEFEAIARFYVGFRAGHDLIPNLESNRGKNVAFFPVGIKEQSNMRRAVGIVLNSRYPGRNTFLIALEVDHAVSPLVAASALPCRNAACVVAAAGFAQRFDQALLRPVGRYFLEGGICLKPTAGRCRLHFPDCHFTFSSPGSTP